MSTDPLSDPLPDRILKLLTQERKLAYAQVAPDLTVSSASDNLRESLSTLEDQAPIAGRQLGDLFWEFAGLENELAAILAGTLPEFTIENANRDQPDGLVRYFNLRVVPLDETNPSRGLLLTVEDNTTIGTLEQMLVQERNNLRLTQTCLARANVELTRLNRIKSLFLSIAAHDLRAPISAIRGYAGLVQSEMKEFKSKTPEDAAESAAESAEFLAIIVSQVDHLNRLISDLLNLERIEQGKLLIQPVLCDLVTLIHGVSEALQPVAAEQGLKLSIQDPGVPVYVLADPDRIQQILYNLLGNALKYTQQGGCVQVTCLQEGKWGVFQVADTGRGIPPNELAQVFELYHRSEEAMQSQVRGTGLGLYIVKSLVDALGGEISVSSQLDQGTTFTIRLPRSTISTIRRN